MLTRVPYRSFTLAAPRHLVVRNLPRASALAANITGVVLLLGGCVLMPLAYLTSLLLGAEVLLSAMGTVFLIAGVVIAVLGARMRRSRTFFALERQELTITVRGGGPERRHVVRVEDIEHVGLDNLDEARGATYSVQIVLRGGDAIALGDARTSARTHHERVAEEIRGFLAAV
jgi:hypothetical protein